ncbi:MAG: hypothetical protein NTY07_06210 [Bacteroidia bacterium]|nr:hypothetical protein [Bacteroidia bacterium]
MKRTKYLLVIILIGLFALSVKGSYKSEIYNCYVNNHMPVWKNIIDQLNSQPEKSNELLLELVNYQYGYIGWCLTNNRKDEALEYLKLAEENVKLLETKKFELSLINAYKSAFYGYRIALSKFMAPFLGPKSSSCANQAIHFDPSQPFGYIQLGNVKFHSPTLMGGSKTEAIENYLKAKALMEKKKEEIRGDWNYLSLLITIAKAYESINDLPKAKLMYEEILKFEPGFTWVKDELYPQLLKKS